MNQRRLGLCLMVCLMMCSIAPTVFGGGATGGGDLDFISARVDPIVRWVLKDVAFWAAAIAVVLGAGTYAMFRGQGGGGVKAIIVAVVAGGIALNAESIVQAWGGEGALIPGLPLL